MKKGWQLDRGLWQDLEKVMRDIKWLDVPLHFRHAGQVPMKPGVYLICGHPPVMSVSPHSDCFNVIYAGRSETSILDRFKKHCNSPDKSIKQIKQCYGFQEGCLSFFFTTLRKDLVKPVEAQLIKCYGPAANQRSGDDVLIPGKLLSGIPAG